MAENVKIQKSDKPIEKMGDDKLGFDKYVKGVGEFIRDCEMPMSIALKGDWGCGKTSFINLLKNYLEGKEDGQKDGKEKEKLKCVFFDAWPYSQFDESEDFFRSFITKITEDLSGGLRAQWRKITKSIQKGFFKVLSSTYIKGREGKYLGFSNLFFNIFFDTQKNRYKEIEKLKKEYEKLIEEVCKHHTKKEDGNNEPNTKVVIFIDNLDRLEPSVCLKLLEIIKQFLDVDRCVYVIAIDDHILKRGLREKFKDMIGEDDDDCEKYFQKIFQVPFYLGVETSNKFEMTDSILDEFFKEQKPSKEIKEHLRKFISDVLENNPRNLKRLYNCYKLSSSVGKMVVGSTDAGGLKVAALLILSTLQVVDENAYREMSDKYSELINQGNGKKEIICSKIKEVLAEGTESPFVKNGLETLEKIIGEPGNIGDFVEALAYGAKAAENTSSRKPATVVTHIVVKGTETEVKSATEAVCQTFEKILNAHPDRIEGFVKKYPRDITFDGNASDGKFRAKKKLEIDALKEKSVYLATSTNFDTKTTQVNNLCRYMLEPPGEVIWYEEDGGKVVFKSDGCIAGD